MDIEQSRQEFARLQKKITSINHVLDLLFFDAETAAPASAARNRISTLEVINDDLFNLKFGEKTTELVEHLREHESELSIEERRSLNLLKREEERTKRVSKEEYIAYQNLLASAQEAWHRANEESDYEYFRPYLERIFETARGFASNAGFEANAYDYCLEFHEPGSTTKMYDVVFDGVKREIVPMLREIMKRPPVDDSCLKGDYSVAKQEELAKYLMEILGLDMTKVGLSTSEHPFTKRMGSHFDERITTRYSRKDFTFSLYTILFGCGYALTEMGQGDEVAYTLADGSASFGIMEAQTRLYENAFGRSKPFIKYIYPKLKQLFPTSIRDSSPEDLYLAVNKVSAGPIRMGSDELTNNIHVLIRYEMEKALMNKDLSFKELPDAWAEKYKECLGVEVKDHAHGVLQDMLWADAAIGYFPTAVLGNVYSALILKRMVEDINPEECIIKGDFASINNWNREHVWKHIGLYDSPTVMEKFVGVSSIDINPYAQYLRYKYSEIYKI